MKKAIVLFTVLSSVGCGAILNSSTATVNGPHGTTVNGNPVPVVVSQKASHQVSMPNGNTCVITSSASGGYIIADIFLTGLLGIVIDAATGAWKVLDAGACPGVTVD